MSAPGGVGPGEARVRLRIVGRVQGVGYRAFARAAAVQLGLAGHVRNEPDGSVSLVAEGPRAALEALEATCREGPHYGRVDAVDAVYGDATGARGPFEIRG